MEKKKPNVLTHPIGRRAFLQRAGIATAALALPSTLLTACGDDDDGIFLGPETPGNTATPTATPTEAPTVEPLTVDPNTPWWLQNNFAPVTDEIDATDLPVRGTIPPSLNGTYVRNGSNPLNADSPHWFLGDGMVHGVRIENGRALWYRNRYVQTPFLADGVSFDDAVSAGLPPGGANSQSNVSVVYHAGRLLSSGEVGFPYEIDPTDLSTIGAYNFGRRLDTSFTAHPKIDPVTGYLHFFGYGFFPPNFLTYHVADETGALIHSQPISIPNPTMIHSFAITEQDVVFWDLPVVFDFNAALGGSTVDAFQWQSEQGARIGIMPLGGAAREIRWVEIDPCYVFHEVNAFRNGDDVVIDVCRHDKMFAGNDLNETDLTIRRWTVNTAGEHLTFSEDIVSDRQFELPSHDRRFSGRAHQYGWFVHTRDRTDTVDLAGIGQVDYRTGDTKVWDPGLARHANEAFFVPEGTGEGEGWLLTMVYDHTTQRSALAILDALNIEAGPVAEIDMPRRVPHGFHATWVPA